MIPNRFTYSRYQACLLLLFCLLAGRPVYGQNQQPDWGFIKFLIDREEYNRALLALDKFSLTNTGSCDSAGFYRGWALYNEKQLKESTESFSRVSPSSPLFVRSGLFGSWNQAYLKDYPSANNWLSRLNSSSPDEAALIRFETLGMQLLARNLAEYKVLRSDVSNAHYAWNESLDKMDHYAHQLGLYKAKSPVLSGLFSSVIPGLGKIYTGQIGSGISAFLTCGAMGAITVENGLRSGWGHWSTWVFGSLFTLFYAGNIYGSIVAKAVGVDQQEDMDQRILLDMHLPLREFYR